MIEEVFLFEDDPFVVLVLAEGEFTPESLPGGRGRVQPHWYVPWHIVPDDIEEQVEDALREAQLQQLEEARGIALANRLYQKQIDDARALSLLSASRNAAIVRDPLHRPLPQAAASLHKHLKQERERESILPQPMKDALTQMKRDAALEEANRVREEKKKHEEEIRQTRLANLEKARKARKK